MTYADALHGPRYRIEDESKYLLALEHGSVLDDELVGGDDHVEGVELAPPVTQVLALGLQEAEPGGDKGGKMQG